MFEQSDDFIDEADLKMLKLRQAVDSPNYKQQVPKWLHVSWDAFRLVENHTKSMIFSFPTDPRNSEFKEYQASVSNHVDLETIKNKLTLKLYKNINDFKKDMELMFDNWVRFRGKEHKLFKSCMLVKDRFEKYMDKVAYKVNIEE